MKALILLILITSQLFSASLSNKNYGTAIVDEVTSIYDGDTFRANIKGYPDIVGDRMSIRINGIDTPEMRGKCQKEKELARKAKQVTVKALRGAQVVELRNMKRGKYFRIVADVYADNSSVGRLLIEKGLAVKYDGGTKVMNWCK
jgi:endonuclease YncB( thermonuclease family)